MLWPKNVCESLFEAFANLLEQASVVDLVVPLCQLVASQTPRAHPTFDPQARPVSNLSALVAFVRSR